MIDTRDYISGSRWWVNSGNLSFKEILMHSGLPDDWSRYNLKDILNIDSVIKPVNNYVLNLYPKPEILNISDTLVTFRQRTHAEIWVQETENDAIYALDKCHQRQFYPSLNRMESQECFKPTYRFYIPWFINKNVIVEISPVNNEKTPFYINKKNIISNLVEDNTEFVDTEFVDFQIKNTGEYHLKEKYGIISKNTAMYDMTVSLTKKEIQKIGEQYGK